MIRMIFINLLANFNISLTSSQSRPLSSLSELEVSEVPKPCTCHRGLFGKKNETIRNYKLQAPVESLDFELESESYSGTIMPWWNHTGNGKWSLCQGFLDSTALSAQAGC